MDAMAKKAAEHICQAVVNVAEVSGSSQIEAAQAVLVGSMKIIRCESEDMKEAVEIIMRSVEMFMTNAGMDVHVVDSNMLN